MTKEELIQYSEELLNTIDKLKKSNQEYKAHLEELIDVIKEISNA